MQLVEPVRRHHHHALVAETAGQECEEGAGGPVGPVDVFDREKQGSVASELVEQAEQGLEETRLRGVVALELADRGGLAAEPGYEGPELGASRRGEAVKHWIVLPYERP